MEWTRYSVIQFASLLNISLLSSGHNHENTLYQPSNCLFKYGEGQLPQQIHSQAVKWRLTRRLLPVIMLITLAFIYWQGHRNSVKPITAGTWQSPPPMRDRPLRPLLFLKNSVGSFTSYSN